MANAGLFLLDPLSLIGCEIDILCFQDITKPVFETFNSQILNGEPVYCRKIRLEGPKKHVYR